MGNLKNDKRRQHYVPKFYLRNFSENGKAVGLYLFKVKKIIEYGSINDNLWEEYFYGEDAVVENRLAEYEGKWKKIIFSIIETERLPETRTDLILLRYFILISSARTLKRGEQMNNDCMNLTKKVLEVEDSEQFEKIMSMGEGRLSAKVKYPTLPFLEVARELLPSVIDLKIELLINRSSIDYVTSDNPAVFYNQLFQEKNLSREFGWGEYGIQFIIPISPKIAICMYDSAVYDIKETELKSNNTINKLNELFLNNSNKLLVFMYGGDAKTKNEKWNYINGLVKRRASSLVQDEDDNMTVFSNKQVVGKNDLSDIFEIKQKYREMEISNHSKEEIAQKLNSEIEKIAAKLQAMTEDERETLLKSKKSELIGLKFDDMERPWVKFYDNYKTEIMDLLKSENK